MRMSGLYAGLAALVLISGPVGAQTGPSVQRDIRREENKQSSIAALTKKTAEDLRRIKEEYVFNGLGHAGGVEALEEASATLERLADPASSQKFKNMPWVLARLSAAREVEEALKRAEALVSASSGQQWIIEELGKLLASVKAEFGEDSAGGFLRELIDRQERLMEDTSKLAESALGKTEAELSPEERAERDRLAEQQASLKEDVRSAVQQMRDMARQLAESAPERAQALEQAASRLEQSQAAEAMQSASENIQRNQLGTAQEDQDRALDALMEAQRMASSAPEQNPISELYEQLEQVQDLIKRQEQLLDQTQALDQNSTQQEYNSLQGEQLGLKGELRQMLGQERPQQGQEQFQQPLARAEQAMGRASAELGQQDKDEAAQAMQEALENLRAARSEMAMALAQMQPGRQESQQPGMPDQQSQQAQQQALQTRTYQPNERRALYGNEKDERGRSAWQVELPPKEREVLVTSAKERFPEGYERLLQLYYRNLAVGVEQTGR